MDTFISISKEKEKQNNFLKENNIKEELYKTRERLTSIELNVNRLNSRMKGVIIVSSIVVGTGASLFLGTLAILNLVG